MRNHSVSKYFTKLQLMVTILLAGPLPAGYLLSVNFARSASLKAAGQAKRSGLIAGVITYFIGIFLTEQFILPGSFSDSPRRGGAAILLFLVLHGLWASLYHFYALRLRGGFPGETSPGKLEGHSWWTALPYMAVGFGLTAFYLLAGPFPFTFLAVYLLPHLYLYGHLRKVFTSKRAKHWFTVVFVFVLLLFPLTMALDMGGRDIFWYARMAGYYYLPVLLYLLLFYLLFDLVQLVNRLSAFVHRNAFKSARLRAYLLAFFLLAIGIIMGVGIHNFNHTTVQSYQVDIPRKQASVDEVTIAMAADLHLSSITRMDFLEQFVDQLNAIDADVVLLPGDILESSDGNSRLRAFERQMRRIKASYGVYAVEGNHEHYGSGEGLGFFERSDIRLLQDTVVRVDNAFYLVGRRDRHQRNRQSLGGLLQSAGDSLPTLVMDHQPYELGKVASQNVDIQFSGHTHHGQLFPINFITRAIYRLSWGHQEIDGTHFFVTCGAQGWGPPVKTSSRSEIMKIKVQLVER